MWVKASLEVWGRVALWVKASRYVWLKVWVKAFLYLQIRMCKE